MKEQKQLPKSRWLFLSLLSLLLTLGGSTSAWAADPVTDDFTSYSATSSGQTLGDNWYVYPGDDGSYGRFGSDYTYKHNDYDGADYNYVSGYSSNYNKNVWLVLKKEVSGTVSFRCKMSSSTGTIYVTNKVTSVGDGTFTVDKSGAQSYSVTTTTSSKEYDAGVSATYVAFCIASSNLRLLDVTYTPYEAPTSPVLTVKDGETLITSPYAFNFGQATVGTTHTFTLSNTGAGNIEGLSVEETGSFGATLSANTTEGGDVTLTITMPATTSTSDITISSTTEGIDDFVINASATVAATFAIDATSYNFGMVAKNAVAEKTFNITNSGNKDLEVTFTNGTKFTVDKKNKKFITFSNNKKWDKVYLYAWKNSTENLTASWPGDEQTNKIGTNIYGEDIYLIEIPEGTENIIIDDNSGSQTQDLTMDYSKSGLYLGDAVAGKYAGVFYGAGDLLVPIGLTAPFAIQMNTATVGAKAAEDIALAYTASNGTSTNVNVSGYVIDDTKFFEDFSGNALPDGWSDNTGWTFVDGNAYVGSSKQMTLPALTIADSEKMALYVKPTSSYSSSLYYYTSTDGGETWSAKSSDLASGLTTNVYSVVYIEGIDAGNYMLKLEGSYIYIDAINGFTVNPNAPRIGRYSDEDCTVAIEKNVTKDFSFVTEAPAEATKYYLKNIGTGTMTLSLGDVPTGFIASLDKTSVTAGDKAILSVNIDDTKKGYHNGDIVVTAAGLSNFTVTATDVMIDDTKLNLNFATDDIPASWTPNNWVKNAGGYLRAGYSSTTMETSKLTATAGEQIVIVAKNEYTGSYTFGVNYKKIDAEEWSTLIAAANQGTSWKTLTATIAEAGDYLLQFVGNYANIQRIYGLTEPNEPYMVVYDGENVAGASYAFTTVNDEAPVSHEFTVKNTGKAKLTGLAAALTGTNADHYTVAITGATGEGNDEIEADAQATVTVTQKAIVGTHEATLTISATGLDSKEIALSGETTDHTALNIDFSTAGVWPAEILEHEGWNVNWGTANQPATTAASMIVTPLTVANASDVFNFKVQYYSSSQSSKRDLVINYTTDGGLTWNPYNWGTALEPVTSLKSQITSSLKNFEITNIPAGTVAFDFSGTYISVDDITGDMKVTSAPLMTFTEVSDGISGANLKADGVATYTLANKGNADYATTVTLDGVSAAISGEGVTYDGTNLTIPAGKTADITVTMTFEAPYGVKNGSVQLAKAGWVDPIALNYTATLVDPTDFVEDFSGNAKPAGWYSENWVYSGETASIYQGVPKPMITEKIGAEAGKNVLSFDAKINVGSDEQTLKVYTSTDPERKVWSDAQSFTLTDAFQTFALTALADGEYYVKFEADNAMIDNITGVKKLAAPAHDLYEVSADVPNDSRVPGSSYTAIVKVVSLRADETAVAELWVEKDAVGTKVAELTGQAMTVDVTKTFELTGNLPAVAGDYTIWVTVKNSDNSAWINTTTKNITLADTHEMAITTFENAAGVNADDNNQYAGTFFVTVENTGSTAIAANEVSVTLTDASSAEFTSTWTAENSNVLYMNSTTGGDDISAASAKLGVWMWTTDENDGAWAAFTKINDGFYSVNLNGNTNFKVYRQDPAKDFDKEDTWNKSETIALSDGNLVKFTNYSGAIMNFTSESMAYLEPTMTTILKVNVNGTLTAGDDANISFTAKEDLGGTSYSLPRNLHVTAAPVIIIKESDGSITPAVTGTVQNRKVTMQRYFNAEWNTICVPFAIADVEAAFGADAKAFGFTGYNAGALEFEKVTALAAATPYILYLPNAISIDKTLSGLTVTDDAAGNVVSGGVTFQGTYLPMAVGTMTGNYGVTSAGKIQKAGTGASIKGFRAYFTGGDLAGAHIAIYDDATGITTILDEKELNYDGKVYNLNGQRVENAHKGVFIVNGKKVVVK